MFICMIIVYYNVSVVLHKYHYIFIHAYVCMKIYIMDIMYIIYMYIFALLTNILTLATFTEFRAAPERLTVPVFSRDYTAPAPCC